MARASVDYPRYSLLSVPEQDPHKDDFAREWILDPEEGSFVEIRRHKESVARVAADLE